MKTRNQYFTFENLAGWNRYKNVQFNGYKVSSVNTVRLRHRNSDYYDKQIWREKSQRYLRVNLERPWFSRTRWLMWKWFGTEKPVIKVTRAGHWSRAELTFTVDDSQKWFYFKRDEEAIKAHDDLMNFLTNLKADHDE